MARKTRKEKIASAKRKTHTEHPVQTPTKAVPTYSPSDVELKLLSHTKKDAMRTLLLITCLLAIQYVLYVRIDSLRGLLLH